MGGRRVIVILLVVLTATLAAEQSASMSKRGNIRFGPSTEAPVVITLPVGTAVTVLGAAPGRDGWYQIRFPRQGHAWMHTAVLAETDDPRVFQVTVDGANVRSDARRSAQMVDRLATGDTVEWVGSEVEGQWIGRKVADWYAVYPPEAVAYAHHSVLSLRPGDLAAMQEEAVTDNRHEILWQDARRRYRRYRQQLAEDGTDALARDWHGLGRDLAEVVEHHPTFRTRLLAKKLYAGIQSLIKAVRHNRIRQGLQPVAVLPDVPDPVRRPVRPADAGADTGSADTAAAPVKPAEDPATAPVDPPAEAADPAPQPVDTAEAAEPEVPDLPAVDADDPEAPAQPAADGSDAIVGWLVQKEVPTHDAHHALIDEQNQVAALLRAGDATPVQLSEFYWRRVAVSGPRQPVSATVDGIAVDVPLLTVTDLRLVK